VREGQPFAAPMRLTRSSRRFVVQMVEVGEQTGALDEMLQRLAIMYNDEVEQTADNLATILEPSPDRADGPPWWAASSSAL